MKHIDPHVHCRDGKEAYKTNIREVSEEMKKQEKVAMFDMHPIFSEEEAKKRIRLAEERKPVIKYFFYIAITANKKQIKEAVGVVNAYRQAVGLKLRTVNGVNWPGVPKEKDQRKIYKFLADLDYTGVLAVHCEKEKRLKPKLWDPRKPWTHCLAQPIEAEVESIEDQINSAIKAKFKGHLHICHISCQKSADLVCQAKRYLSITSGVTPHHLKWSSEKMKSDLGLLYKVDPPLRDPEEVMKLRECLKNRKIDWIESDYARHTLEEKLGPPFLSGIAPPWLYRELLIELSLQGLTWTDIQDLTYWNIKRVFEQKLKGV